MMLDEFKIDTSKRLLTEVENFLAEKPVLQPEAFKEKLIYDYQIDLLGKLETAFQGENSTVLLEQILRDNWEFIIDTGRYFSYTALPEDRVTLLLCDIAQYLGDVFQKPALSILMPNIQAGNIKDDYPDLTNESLKDVIKTHILSETGGYLIPISVLTSLTETDDVSKLPNYYDDKAISDNYLAELDVKRLWEHSQDTRDLLILKESYEFYLNDNLLGRLYDLAKRLRYGITEGKVDDSAYIAIIAFCEYYNTVSDCQKSQIPKVVRDEIDLLIRVSSETLANTKTLDACLVTRSNRLLSAVTIDDNQTSLSVIGIDGEAKKALLLDAKKKFETQKEKLANSIREKKYRGRDKTGITSTLLKSNLPIRVVSKQDFRDFLTLSVDDIKNALQKNESLQQEVLAHLDSLESFVWFCNTGATNNQLRVILSVMAVQIFADNSLEKCFMHLQNERLTIVLDAFKTTLWGKAFNGYRFEKIAKFLNAEQCSIFVAAFANAWCNIVKSAGEFSVVSEVLNEEQRAGLFNAFVITEYFGDIIRGPADLGWVFSVLTEKQCTVVYDFIKDKLAGFNKIGLEACKQDLTQLQHDEVVSLARSNSEEKEVGVIEVFDMPKTLGWISQRRDLVSDVEGMSLEDSPDAVKRQRGNRRP